MGPVLELRDLVKHYASHHALNGVSLAMEQGAFYSLLGPSGCGKTTTLRLIAGFEASTSGQVLLNGTVVNALPPHQRRVSTVFQNYALFPHLNVEDNVSFGLRERRVRDCWREVGEALDMVQLTGKEKRYPAQLSGGERQRVALARSLVLRPDVLLLDEPLAALDPNLRKQMRTELKDLQRSARIAFLFVTHDQDEALSLSDKVAVMNAGRIEQIGTPREVYARPATRFVAGFVGAVNWIEGVGVRPEFTRIARRCPGEGFACRPAHVLRSVFLGNCVHVLTSVATAERAPGEEPFEAGEAVCVYWNPADEIRVPYD